MRKSTLALAFAVVLAVLAVVGVRQYLTREKKEIEKERKTSMILISAEPIGDGERVRPSQIKAFEIPSSMLLNEMILESEKDLVVGKKARKAIDRDRLLLQPYFLERAPTQRVAIRPGMRIASLAVNSVSGVSGLISPGDYVDVIWTAHGTAEGGGAGLESTRTIITQVQVFAVEDVTTVGYRASRRGRGPGASYSTVTLLLYPMECELITYAAGHGKVTLVKRGATDTSIPVLSGVDASTVDDRIADAKRVRERGGEGK